VTNTPDKGTLWRQLGEHQKAMTATGVRIEQLFKDQPQRYAHYSLSCNESRFDFSKNLVTDETLSLLIALASACGLESAIESMFKGEHINTTEDRPALHVALRGHIPQQLPGAAQEVADCLAKMTTFVDTVQRQSWRGFNGDAITDVINIGIGGSDLGPAMVSEALTRWHVPMLRVHFVSNVDPEHLRNTLANLHPASTLFIVASKSFTTLETLENAQLAKRWYAAKGGDVEQIAKHFVAATANVEKACAFGIHPDNIFPLWDWVGGRYSLWSAIGLPIALAVGMTQFKALLQGARTVDLHFQNAPLRQNIPVIMGLLSVWYGNFWGADSQVILPYAQNLHLLPSFLQQLEMESLGKSVDQEGRPVSTRTGLVIWGSAGTNGQHSFHQLLHQGTHFIPADFITAAIGADSADQAQHQHLLANCFSQSQALMLGNNAADPHRAVVGNRPSNTLLLRELTPTTLGGIIAMYEHKVYVQSVIWGINAFDQWGVEIGKQLSGKIYPALQQEQPCTGFDDATNGLINQYRNFLHQQ
jgi:glucose-6-phosphate isomerase